MHSQHYRIHDELNQQVYYINIHHNGDYSGNAIINVRKVPVVAAPVVDSQQLPIWELDNRYPTQELELPMGAIKKFMAAYIRNKRIAELENAETDDLL